MYFKSFWKLMAARSLMRPQVICSKLVYFQIYSLWDYIFSEFWSNYRRTRCVPSPRARYYSGHSACALYVRSANFTALRSTLNWWKNPQLEKLDPCYSHYMHVCDLYSQSFLCKRIRQWESTCSHHSSRSPLPTTLLAPAKAPRIKASSLLTTLHTAWNKPHYVY